MRAHRTPDPEAHPTRLAILGHGPPAGPPLPRPAPARLRPIRRSWLLATWQARAAVLAGVPLADFLRARLARYLVDLPVPRARLPIRVELAGDEIRAALVEDPVAPAPEGPAPAALVALEGPTAARRWAEAQARLAALEGEVEAARRRAEEIAARLMADVAAGTLVPAPDPAQTGRDLGRPPVRSPAAALGLGAVALAAILAEAWALAMPALLAGGDYPPRLEPGPGAAALALALTFALGLAVGLLALALAALEAAGRARATKGARRRSPGGGLGALAAAAGVAAAAGAPVVASGMAPGRGALLLLALPAGAALTLRAARGAQRRRAADLEAALAWDRGRARDLAARGRRLEELAWAEARHRALLRRCTRARERVRALARRDEAAARLLARAAGRERAARHRLALSLLGALERDRYEYVRQAAARGLAPAARAAEGAAPGEGRVAV